MEPLTVDSLDGIPLDAAYLPSTRPDARGAVLQAHGITADLDEGGMFIRIADQLTQRGYDVLRFSYRGHGRSGGTQRGTTIAGEMLDLQAATAALQARSPAPLSIIAASFGAVSTSLLLPYLDTHLRWLVLWNPVLDLQQTFIEPELAWGRTNFGPTAVRHLSDHGYLLLDGTFEIGRTLYEELRTYTPMGRFTASTTPAAIVHGDHDEIVPYQTSVAAANAHPSCDLITIDGARHGFDPDKEDQAIDATLAWIDQHDA